MNRTAYNGVARDVYSEALHALHTLARERTGRDTSRDCLRITTAPGRREMTHRTAGVRVTAVTTAQHDRCGPLLLTTITVRTSENGQIWDEHSAYEVEVRAL